MSFPISDFELAVALVGHSEAFDTFKPREEMSFGDFNLSCPAGRIRAFIFLRKNMPSDCFIHVFGYLLYSLNLMVSPATGTMIDRSVFSTRTYILNMFRRVDNSLLNDQAVMVQKLIQNRALFADACCRHCGITQLRVTRRKRECWYYPVKKTCVHLGTENHEHFGKAKIHSHYLGRLMRYVCFGCTKAGYYLNEANNLCHDTRILSTIHISDTL